MQKCVSITRLTAVLLVGVIVCLLFFWPSTAFAAEKQVTLTGNGYVDLVDEDSSKDYTYTDAISYTVDYSELVNGNVHPYDILLDNFGSTIVPFDDSDVIDNKSIPVDPDSESYYWVIYESETGTYECYVQITSVTPTQSTQTITASDITCKVGATGVTVSASTDGDEENTLSYACSDTSVCTVAEDGTITPLKAGTATITITAAASDWFAEATKTITVTVTEDTASDDQTDDTENADTSTEDTGTVTDGTGTDVPKTGDETNVGFWILLMLASLTGAAGMAFGTIRRR